MIPQTNKTNDREVRLKRLKSAKGFSKKVVKLPPRLLSVGAVLTALLIWFLATNPGKYDLNLMSLESTAALPTEGKSVVIVAKSGDFYSARIFDRTGDKVIDRGKGEFSPDEMLVQQFEAGLSDQSINTQTKSELIKKITFSLGYTPRGWVNPLFFPSPQSVWTAFVDVWQNGYKGRPLIQHIWASMQRVVIALVMALATAVPLGLASGYFKLVQALLDPFIEFYRPLPPLAYYTLLVIWLGIEDESKIALLYLAGFAPLYIAMVSGVRRVPRDRIHAALSLGSSQWQVFTQIIFPSCLPELFTGLRTALGFMYTTLVAAEMVAAVSGIGWMVLDASKFLRSDIIFVGILIMGIIAIALDLGLRWLQNRYLPWIGHE